MNEWQPIETAPKDGRDFIGAQKQSFGQWQIGDCCYEFGFFFYRRKEKWWPSHWMPLPEAPK